MLIKSLWCLVAVFSLCQLSWAKAGLSELTAEESQFLGALLMIGSFLFYLPSWSASILFVASLLVKDKIRPRLFIAGIVALLAQFILKSQVRSDGIVEDMHSTFRLLMSPSIRDGSGFWFMLALPTLGTLLAVAAFAISGLIHTVRWFVKGNSGLE